jgi:coenzyme F420 hydrogenase subunit beta
MSVKSKDKLLRVMRSHLCNRCGSCAGLSEGRIVFTDREGVCRPVAIAPLEDTLADLLWAACSGKEFSFPAYREHFYPGSPHFHQYIGPYQQLFTGFAADPAVRYNGASGGVLSAILIYLLENQRIDGAVVTRMSRQKPWLAEPFIATSKTEIMEAAQSKYIITPVNEILSESRNFKGRLAFVGLPPHVQSVRKLQHINDPSVKNLSWIFGPFYGNTLHFSSVKSFLRSYGEKDHTQVKKLWFRHGEWPGNMRAEMQNGKVYELKKFHANYLIPFHILRNSLYCTDLANEFTDISGGDAWSPEYEERGQGYSMVITRSREGQALINEMNDAGWLNLKPIPEEEAIAMHSHGYDFKKRGSFIRIRFRKLLGKDVPDNGYVISGFPVSRYLMEVLINTLFILLGTSPARWLVEQLPPAFIGRIFEKARTRWKRSTYSIKRKHLG